MQKNHKYKHQLEAQLQEKNTKERLEHQMEHNPMEQKMLTDDYKRFAQKEYDRVNQGRMKTKNMMKDNQTYLQRQVHNSQAMHQEDKDVFNRQALEDKLHAERTAEEKRKWKDWQRESLKNDYDEQIRNKEILQKMEREKEKDYASQYRNTVEKYEHDHNKTLNDRRQRNEEVLSHQQRMVIPDVNDTRKRDAVYNMKKQFESTEKQTLMSELGRLNQRQTDAQQTKDTLRAQMDLKNKQRTMTQNDEASYKRYMDNTVNMLSERDRKIAEDRHKLKAIYAKDLESQIKEHNQKEKTTYNEMDERNLTLNQRGLAAYETNQRKAGIFKLPGIDRDPQDDREYFGRYARKKEPSKIGAEMQLNHQLGMSDTQSYARSYNPISNGNTKTLPYSQNRYKEAPKTSEDFQSRGKRSSKGFNPHQNQNNHNSGLGNYHSMANLEKHQDSESKPSQDTHQQEIDTIQSKKPSLISQRDQDGPEYQPTKRDDNQKRVLPGSGVTRSISSINFGQEYNEQKPIKSSSPDRISKEGRSKKAPEYLLSIDSMLNNRIKGALRAGNLSTSKDNDALSRIGGGRATGASTYRSGYLSDMH